jgi:hypothetical protein
MKGMEIKAVGTGFNGGAAGYGGSDWNTVK